MLGYQLIVTHQFSLDDHSAMLVQSNDVKRAATEGGVNLNKPEVAIDSNDLGVFVVRVPDLAPPSQLNQAQAGLNYRFGGLDTINPTLYVPLGTGQGPLFNVSSFFTMNACNEVADFCEGLTTASIWLQNAQFSR